MATIKKAQDGYKSNPYATADKAKKPVVKKGTVVEKKTTVTAKPKTASQRIGDITLRDVKNSAEDALNITTLGGYSKVKKALGGEYKYKKLGEKKNGGKVTKAKNGKSFPDLNKDGKVTKADILKGRGVIAKKGAKIKKTGMHKMPDGSMMKNSAMKSGGSMKKCKYGCK